jgi:tripartite-type tricarboxylate transporter receptor subunit TctC
VKYKGGSLQDPEIKRRFLALGLEPAGNAPDEFGEFIKTQSARYGSVVKQANVRLD